MVGAFTSGGVGTAGTFTVGILTAGTVSAATVVFTTVAPPAALNGRTRAPRRIADTTPARRCALGAIFMSNATPHAQSRLSSLLYPL
jgi:hypothetical protein